MNRANYALAIGSRLVPINTDNMRSSIFQITFQAYCELILGARPPMGQMDIEV